ncbi:hypothetical protein VTP01DRAFT_4239 [Rhizomucor pusillus]|uniref:uncharacterized protein n=1 Tax=Rhizomucor pusillus TaxID=4840 RepID=UPI0037422CB0
MSQVYTPDPRIQLEQENEKIINEEYKTWKKNTPFLYDVLVSHAMEWPSLTCQWFPDVQRFPDEKYKIQRLLLGTHTNDEDRNYVQIATIRLPDDQSQDITNEDNAMDTDDGNGTLNASYEPHVKIEQKIVHEGEVNRARYQPDNQDIIATKSRSGDVYIFDRKSYSAFPKVFERFEPTLQLLGHNNEGYGLEWNPHPSKSSHIISASFDNRICHWDIGANPKSQKTLDPLRTFTGHASPVEDVAWHRKFESIFGSVGDDGNLMIWDIRNPSNDTPVHDIHAHFAEANCIAFNPYNEWVLATGAGDKLVALWDLRNPSRKLHELRAHNGEILQLAWSPHNEAVLATAGSDRRVLVWDLSRIGKEQTPEEIEDGPPELLFMHGGHTNKISDIAWNPAEPWMLASTAEDNIVQVWEMTSNVYAKHERNSPEHVKEEKEKEGMQE